MIAAPTASPSAQQRAGVMGDLGMHVAHVPLRVGWRPQTVFGVLQDVVTERPGPGGEPDGQARGR